jgi:hypothetical protein
MNKILYLVAAIALVGLMAALYATPIGKIGDSALPNSHLGADGKWELAASLLESCRTRFARSESVAKAERLVYLKLMEKTQNTDPFKFILYSAKIGEQVPQMGEQVPQLGVLSLSVQ